MGNETTFHIIFSTLSCTITIHHHLQSNLMMISQSNSGRKEGKVIDEKENGIKIIIEFGVLKQMITD